MSDVEKTLGIFKALSCRARFDIVVELIKNQGCNVGKIAQELSIPKANIFEHLSILKKAGIVDGYRKGTQVFYKVEDQETKKIVMAFELKDWSDSRVLI